MGAFGSSGVCVCGGARLERPKACEGLGSNDPLGILINKNIEIV